MSATDEELPTHPHLIHPHTGRPLQAIGVRRNGDPIWPQLGAAPDDEDDAGDAGAEDDDSTGGEGDEDDDKPLGEAGQKALTAEKEKRRKAAERARTAEQRAATAEAELARLKAGKGGDDDKPDAEEIRRTAREEAQAETVRERVLDKIEAKAGRFADPEDAVALLGRRTDEFIVGGKVDVEAIVEALDELLEKKPHLAKQAGGKKRPDPDRSQGAGKNGSSAADIDAQIAEAQKARDFKKVIRLQNEKLAAKNK